MEKTCDRSRVKTQRTKFRNRFDSKKEEIAKEQENLETNSEGEELKVKGHYYNVRTIQLALELLIECGISFRGIEKVFELFKNGESQATPSFTCIRKWLGRIGVYELQREKEYRNDWIFIIDFTLELGKQKALVILGISQHYMVEEVISKGRGLSYEDVELLGLEIMCSTKGEIIQQKLDKLTQQVGVPVQIVADHSSNLACGIKLYQQNHPELIYTHDVTHGMALLLKYKLNSDERYQSFIPEGATK